MKSLNIVPSFPIENYGFQKADKPANHGIGKLIAAKPMKINTYSEMVDLVSKLAYFNRRYVLFFRGQSKEFRVGSPYPTIYPTYFRKIIKKEMTFDQLSYELSMKQEELREKNHNRKPRFQGAYSILESLHVRWALLQHYNICDTPLIDITQSLHVAASFALNYKSEKEESRTGIVYVLALPWPSKNYHNNKEEDIYLVRLSGITPPQAKRPYRQEAYAVTSRDVDFKQIDNMERYDLAKRLVCKFEVTNSNDFWGEFLQPLPESFLAPQDDIFYDFMMNETESSNALMVR
ncbi:MAG: FRG domain-containing protein [Bacteroidota bacterium]